MNKEILRLISTMLMFASIIACTSQTTNHEAFTTRNDKLIDANGKEFVIKGMNNPHIWFIDAAYKALDNIAEVGCNSVRIVWKTTGKDTELEKVIRRCIELEMVPMVELHDATGSPEKERLLDLARWYSMPERAGLLKRYEKYLLINIANEWGDHELTTGQWLDSYSEAVKIMREAGYRTTLVVDAPGWGQNMTPITEAGQDLIDADPLHNILFSIHMYGSWNDPSKIQEELKRCKTLSLPVIVGEFGYNFENGNNNLTCKADHTVIVSTCNDLEYGYMPWSWTGNNEENKWLDLVQKSDWKTLTWWGEQVISAPGGITATAKKASIFK